MTDDRKLEGSSSVVARELGDELMLMDLKTGTYFGLDPVGRRVWQELEKGNSVEQIVQQLEMEFDVTSEQLRQDIRSFLQELLEQDLISEARP